MTAPLSGERLGVALRIGSTLAFAAMVACVKAVGDAAPLGQVVFCRSAFALIPLVAFLRWRGDFPRGLATARPLGHAGRCLMGAAAMFTSFATLRLLPVAEATTLSYLAPVALALMGWALLGERMTARRAGGVALGFAGVLALCGPAFAGARSDGALAGLALGLTTALLTAGALIQVRRLTQAGETAGAIAFWFAAVSAAAGLATAPFGWAMPDAQTAALLVGAGLTGGVAHILMTLSFRHAEAAALAPFEYLSVLWAVLTGLILFGEVPDWSFLLAAPLILAGAVVATAPARVRP